MPGPYAHITLLQELMRPGRVESIFTPSSNFAESLKSYFPFCALGAVSPDYPNLVQGDGSAFQWADVMHNSRACEMMTSGIRRVRMAHGAVRDKQLAWLLGYCAHVVADVTIHPVVQAKVGIYAENQRHHRVCEMSQDSYIYHRMNLGEIGESNIFALLVARCSTLANSTQLDHDIVTLWDGMLKDIHPESYATHQPDSALWHREFVAMVNRDTAGTNELFPLARIITTKMDLTYPAYDMVDRQYIDGLEIPSRDPQRLHYDEIFNHAVDNVAAVWRLVEAAVCDKNYPNLPTFNNWNLDNGRDEFGRVVFWD
jgi:hypothetical protein